MRPILPALAGLLIASAARRVQAVRMVPPHAEPAPSAIGPVTMLTPKTTTVTTIS